LTGTNTESIWQTAVDSQGNIVITGTSSSGTMTIQHANDTAFKNVTLVGGNDGFVIKYQPDGTAAWNAMINGASDNGGTFLFHSDGGVGVAVYSNSASLAIYNAVVNTLAATISTAGNYAALVIKYASNGAFMWAVY
jgi:hypothetical protein